MNTSYTVDAFQNMSNEINNFFNNLTPDYLGVNNYSFEHSDEFSISSMPRVITSNDSITK